MKKKMHFLGLIFLTIRIQTKKKKKKNSASGIKQQVVWPEIQNLY